jgi:AraC family transcriptional regulator of arabinose operon
MVLPYLFSHPHITTPQSNPGKLTHVHSHVELVYCLGGEGYQITPAGLISSRKGDLFCFLPGEPHLSYCGKEQIMELGVVYFDEKCFLSNRETQEWYGEFRKRVEESRSRKIPLTREGAVQTERSVDQIIKEFSNYRAGSRALVLSYLTLLLLNICRGEEVFSKEEIYLSGKDRIDNFLLYLEVNYQQPMSVDYARDFCHLSRSRFHSLFKERTGKGFTEYVNCLRVERAGEQLLSHHESSILTIAESCGFNEISHFCHQFKRFKGCSPRQWRHDEGQN